MIARLSPRRYLKSPWPNRRGVNYHLGHRSRVWWYSRTPIERSGPFSNYRGYVRLQAFVSGKGLALRAQGRMLKVDPAFNVVCFDGKPPIRSHLTAGRVEVVNLIGRRDKVRVALDAHRTGDTFSLSTGIHFIHAPAGTANVMCGGVEYRLARDHALRIEPTSPMTISVGSGRVLAASILNVP